MPESQVPAGWTWTNLAALGDYVNGFAFNERYWSSEGFPIVRIAQITGSQPIVDRFAGHLSNAYRLDDDDLIFSWSGTLAVVRWSGGPAWLNQHLFKVVARRGIERDYLFHLLQRSVGEMDKRAHGSTMKHIKRGELAEFDVAVPDDPAEQCALASVLNTLDTTIRQTEAIIEKLKQVKQGLLHDLLTRGIDANGELRPPQSQALHLYKPSPLGWIPKEWEIRSLADACVLIKDGTHLPPERVSLGPLLLSVRNMKDGKFVLTDQDTRVPESFYRAMHGTWVINKGDVLLAIVGATIGKTAIVGDMPKFTLQRSVAVLRGLSDELSNDFLFATIGSRVFQNALWGQVNQTAQPGIYLDQLGAIRICLPAFVEQGEIVKRLTAFDDRIEREAEGLNKMQQQKSGLMDDLLTGRVRVTPLLQAEAAAA